MVVGTVGKLCSLGADKSSLDSEQSANRSSAQGVMSAEIGRGIAGHSMSMENRIAEK